jgi:hypothetical protein
MPNCYPSQILLNSDWEKFVLKPKKHQYSGAFLVLMKFDFVIIRFANSMERK